MLRNRTKIYNKQAGITELQRWCQPKVYWLKVYWLGCNMGDTTGGFVHYHTHTCDHCTCGHCIPMVTGYNDR